MKCHQLLSHWFIYFGTVQAQDRHNKWIWMRSICISRYYVAIAYLYFTAARYMIASCLEPRSPWTYYLGDADQNIIPKPIFLELPTIIATISVAISIQILNRTSATQQWLVPFKVMDKMINVADSGLIRADVRKFRQVCSISLHLNALLINLSVLMVYGGFFYGLIIRWPPICGYGINILWMALHVPFVRIFTPNILSANMVLFNISYYIGLRSRRITSHFLLSQAWFEQNRPQIAESIASQAVEQFNLLLSYVRQVNQEWKNVFMTMIGCQSAVIIALIYYGTMTNGDALTRYMGLIAAIEIIATVSVCFMIGSMVYVWGQRIRQCLQQPSMIVPSSMWGKLVTIRAIEALDSEAFSFICGDLFVINHNSMIKVSIQLSDHKSFSYSHLKFYFDLIVSGILGNSLILSGLRQSGDEY